MSSQLWFLLDLSAGWPDENLRDNEAVGASEAWMGRGSNGVFWYDQTE